VLRTKLSSGISGFEPRFIGSLIRLKPPSGVWLRWCEGDESHLNGRIVRDY
jgi:hypothetical protein